MPSASNAPRLPGQIVLVMQGGGAQGAYQGGVYQALHEAGIEPDWVIGTSIGAINGSIIAGNAVVQRLERLRQFWSHVESPPPGILGLVAPMFGSPATDLATLLNGVSGFFSPNAAFLKGVDAPVGVEHAAGNFLLRDIRSWAPGGELEHGSFILKHIRRWRSSWRTRRGRRPGAMPDASPSGIDGSLGGLAQRSFELGK